MEDGGEKTGHGSFHPPSGVHMRVGVFGGTFDPIHLGHLIVAQEVRFRIPLDRLLFVPAGQPPHKPNRVVTPAVHRLAMLERALEGERAFAVSRLEVDRPGPSYSVDTLRALRADLGPGVELYFVLGTDQLADLPTWHRPRELLALCHLIAVQRPGVACDLTTVARRLPGLAERTVWVPVPQIAIAAREIRRRVAAGEPIRYLVPDAVAAYIAAHGLYRDHADGCSAEGGQDQPDAQ